LAKEEERLSTLCFVLGPELLFVKTKCRFLLLIEVGGIYLSIRKSSLKSIGALGIKRKSRDRYIYWQTDSKTSTDNTSRQEKGT